MPTAQDILAVIQKNYTDALDNEPQDLSNAKDAVQVSTIQANLAAAKLAYYTAVAADLSNTGAGIAAAFAAANGAIAEVKVARKDSHDIATLIGKLNIATTTAKSLISAAAKV